MVSEVLGTSMFYFVLEKHLISTPNSWFGGDYYLGNLQIRFYFKRIHVKSFKRIEVAHGYSKSQRGLCIKAASGMWP